MVVVVVATMMTVVVNVVMEVGTGHHGVGGCGYRSGQSLSPERVGAVGDATFPLAVNLPPSVFLPFYLSMPTCLLLCLSILCTHLAPSTYSP